jgi:hypothetical protein
VERGDNRIEWVPHDCDEEEEQGKKLKTASPSREGKVNGNRLPHSGYSLQNSIGQMRLEGYAKRKGRHESEKQACRMCCRNWCIGSGCQHVEKPHRKTSWSCFDSLYIHIYVVSLLYL